MSSTLFSTAGAARILTAGQGFRHLELGERRFLHPGPLRWLRALGWSVALFFLAAFSSLPLTEVLGHLLPQTEAAMFAASLIGALAALAIYALGYGWL